jgi:hypothetical protein
VQLAYRCPATGEQLAYPVRLVTTRCHFGGSRWWFRCPLVKNGHPCGRRVRRLYLRGRYFGCRHCHDLTYTSSQESDRRVYAALRDGVDYGANTDILNQPAGRRRLLPKILCQEWRRFNRQDSRVT